MQFPNIRWVYSVGKKNLYLLFEWQIVEFRFYNIEVCIPPFRVNG
jgi:hypothetical protein